jgi:hypothetical protein
MRASSKALKPFSGGELFRIRRLEGDKNQNQAARPKLAAAAMKTASGNVDEKAGMNRLGPMGGIRATKR